MKQKSLQIIQLLSIVIAIVMIMGTMHPLSAAARVSGIEMSAEEPQAAQPTIN